jgi:hypothetical protein
MENGVLSNVKANEWYFTLQCSNNARPFEVTHLDLQLLHHLNSTNGYIGLKSEPTGHPRRSAT